MTDKLRIVFMGTPDFAVGILDHILKNKYNVVGVITVADKPAGRGQKIHESAVKKYAVEKKLNVLQPTNLKDPAFLEELAALNANLNIVVAFRMLPEVVWNMPKHGTFNLHASLLPQYRGAAPINWAIINGETKTGVTTFFIDDKIDTGAVILKKETNIGENESAGELHDKLIFLGAETVIETLNLIENNNCKPVIQIDTNELKTAYKLNKDNCKINWEWTGEQIHNHIRGLSPYPAAWCSILDNEQSYATKIYKALFIVEKHSFKNGKIAVSKNSMKIYCSNGYLEINEIQFPGKRKMSINDFLNGTNLSEDAMAL